MNEVHPLELLADGDGETGDDQKPCARTRQLLQYARPLLHRLVVVNQLPGVVEPVQTQRRRRPVGPMLEAAARLQQRGALLLYDKLVVGGEHRGAVLLVKLLVDARPVAWV
eukprot:4631288-Prymnesium_polylepis.1